MGAHMKFTRFILSFAFIFILTSCRGKEERLTREKSLSQGFSLLDQEKYDEAITYFFELARKDPHPLVKLAWASAYAARAGVKIEKIYALVVVRDFSASVPNWQSSDTSVLMQFLRRYERQWEKIPAVSGTSAHDVSAALEILRDLPKPGTSLYRATLRVVLLKSHLSEGLKGWQKVSVEKNCTENLRPYYDWGLQVLQELVRLSEDLEQAYPDKKQNYEQVRRHLEFFQKNVESTTWSRGTLCP